MAAAYTGFSGGFAVTLALHQHAHSERFDKEDRHKTIPAAAAIATRIAVVVMTAISLLRTLGTAAVLLADVLQDATRSTPHLGSTAGRSARISLAFWSADCGLSPVLCR